MGLFLDPVRIACMILAASMHSDELSAIEDAVTRLKHGDLDALAELMAQYQHRLYRFLLRLAQDPALADDFFQQTWLRVIEKIGRYDARRQFTPWLFSVARNLVIDEFRKRRLQSLDAPEETGVTPLDRLVAIER